MATAPSVPYKYLPAGFSPAPHTQINFDSLIKYISDRNDGTAQWDSASIIGDLTVGGTAYLKSINGTFIGVGRNLVVNGDMQFDQRNEGASVALVNNSNTYCCDTFFGYNRGATARWSMQRKTLAEYPNPPFPYYERITITTADAAPSSGAEYVISHRIEGVNFVHSLFGFSGAKSITLSFWVRSSLTGTFGVGFESAASDSQPATYTISSANTWEYKTITIAGDTLGTWSYGEGQIGLKLLWDLGSGSDFANTAGAWTTASEANHVTGNTRVVATNGATWDIAGVQLEIGPIATAFEYKPYWMQIIQAQRFYEKSYPNGTGVGTNTTAGRIQLTFAQTNTTTMESNHAFFKVQKAGLPTMAFWADDGTSGKWDFRSTTGTVTQRALNLDDNVRHGFSVYQTAAVEYLGFGHFTAEFNL